MLDAENREEVLLNPEKPKEKIKGFVELSKQPKKTDF